jgi:hypothetical protein
VAVGRLQTELDVKRLVEDALRDLRTTVQTTKGLVLRGEGSPEGVVEAPVGVLYERSDGAAGTAYYVKESGTGNTGWVAGGTGGGGGTYTDEQAQDAVGGIVTDSGTVFLDYDDVANTITAHSVAFKEMVTVATTAEIALSGLQTIDGRPLGGDERVLVKNQTNFFNNGIYIASVGAWTRAADADSLAKMPSGTRIWVAEGSVNSTSYWAQTGPGPGERWRRLDQPVIENQPLDPIFLSYTGTGGALTANFIDSLADHNQMLNLAVGDAHPQYLTVERMQDEVASFLQAGGGIEFVYQDEPQDKLVVTAPAGVPYTDAQAQQAIEDILTDSATIDFTFSTGAVWGEYNWGAENWLAGNSLTAVVKPDSITNAHINSAAAIADSKLASIYALLAGRPGGQTLIGGTAASDDLTLESTSDAAKGDIKAIVGTSFFVETPTSLTGATNTAIQIGSGQTVTLGAGGGVRALGFLPDIAIEGDPTGVMALLFGFSSQVTLGASAAYDLNGTRIFTNQPTYNMASGIAYGSLGSGATLPMTGFWDGPTYADGPGGATGTVDNVTSFRQALSVGTGWTLTNLRGLHVLAAVGNASGTIGTHVGVDVEDLDAGTPATTNPSLSLRSIGAAVEMRHAGPGVFGANAAPSNSSTGLEVQSTTRVFRLPNLTTTQRDALTPLAGHKVFNTTLAKEQVYDGTAWVSTH